MRRTLIVLLLIPVIFQLYSIGCRKKGTVATKTLTLDLGSTVFDNCNCIDPSRVPVRIHRSWIVKNSSTGAVTQDQYSSDWSYLPLLGGDPVFLRAFSAPVGSTIKVTVRVSPLCCTACGLGDDPTCNTTKGAKNEWVHSSTLTISSFNTTVELQSGDFNRDKEVCCP